MTITVGARLILTIEDLAFGGEGVSRSEDFVIFVPFVMVGEVVEVEVTEVKKRYARARLLGIKQSAKERVEAACKYFGECGGCQYQHIPYPAQLRLKHKQIRDLFQRLGRFDGGLVAPVIPCPQPYGYRNRIMIRTQWDKFKQGLNLGYIRADNRLVVDIDRCEIAEPALNNRLEELRAKPPPKGGLKTVLRITPEGWEVPPDSFFQNNFFLLPRLVEVVRDFLKVGGASHLVDVYCGVGFFGIELASSVKSFVGVELDQLAIRAARKNLANRGLGNGEFVAGAAEELLPGLLMRFTASSTCVLLDPPRKGCASRMLQVLREVQPAQIIYVSCDPATMARDLNVLCGDGVFRLAQVVPLDMFPQTAHVESIADVRVNRPLQQEKLNLSSL